MTGSGISRDSRTTGFLSSGQGITGGYVLEADGGNDIAGICLFYFLTLVGVHFQESSDAFLLAGGRPFMKVEPDSIFPE